MKVLAICQGGNVRSVCFAYLMKYKYGHEALAASWEKNTPDTLRMLCSWADSVVLMEAMEATGAGVSNVPEDLPIGKLMLCDVGPDVWGNPLHPALVSKIIHMVEAGKVVAVLGFKKQQVSP